MKEIIKIGEEISEMETQRTIKNSSETKMWFFEKRNKIDKPSSRKKIVGPNK